MAKGKDERHNPNRKVDRSSFTVHMADVDEPEVMSPERMVEYGTNIAIANNEDDVPNKSVTNVEQAIANAVWAGDEVK